MKLGKILLYQENDSLAVEYLQKAHDLLKISHGPTSKLFKELIMLMKQAKQEL